MPQTFPVELFVAIITLCSKSDLPSLSLTSKILRDISQPLLYRDISISCRGVDTKDQRDKIFRRVVDLYERLRDNEDKAAKVKRLTITELSDHDTTDDCPVPNFTPVLHTPLDIISRRPFTFEAGNYPEISMIPRSLAAILSVMPSLIALHLSGHNINIAVYNPHFTEFSDQPLQVAALSVLDHVFCLALQEFHLDISEDNPFSIPALPCFLQRHSQLNNVKLGIEYPGLFFLEEDTPLSMPNLEQYEAPMGYFDCLEKNSHLWNVSVVFARVEDFGILPQHPVDDGLLTLESFPSLSVLKITQGTRTSDLETISVVATHLPNLQELEIRHQLHPSLLTSLREGLDNSTRVLPRFNSLRRLVYVLLERDGKEFVEIARDEGRDVSIVIGWGLACPTLSYCEIYGTVWELKHEGWALSSA